MKTVVINLFALCLMLTGWTYSAQGQCRSSHALFSSPGSMHAVPMRTLRSNPQMPSLRNISSKDAFFKAIKENRNKDMYRAEYQELDAVLKEIGFAGGLSDPGFNSGSVSYETIPYGTKGMVGHKRNDEVGYMYGQLLPANKKGVQAWRINGPSGCYVYVLTMCGNMFYPSSGMSGKCPEVTVTAEPAMLKRESLVETHEMTVDVYLHCTNCKPKPKKAPKPPYVWLGYQKLQVEGAAYNDYTVTVNNTPVPVCGPMMLPVTLTVNKQPSATTAPTGNQKVVIDVPKKIFKKFKKYQPLQSPTPGTTPQP